MPSTVPEHLLVSMGDQIRPRHTCFLYQFAFALPANSPAQKSKHDRLAPKVPLFLSDYLPYQSQTAEDKYATPLPHREEAQPVDL